MIEESQVLQTHLNLMTDLAGSLDRMLSTISCGRSFFLRRRICGSLVCYIFQRKIGQRDTAMRSETRDCWVLDFVSMIF